MNNEKETIKIPKRLAVDDALERYFGTKAVQESQNDELQR